MKPIRVVAAVLILGTIAIFLARELSRGTQDVHKVVFSPSGDMIVSCWDKDVRLWDWRTDREVSRFPVTGGRFQRPICLAVTRDSKSILVAGQSMGLTLWEISSGQLLRTFQGGSEMGLTAFDVSPDGSSVLAGDFDRNLTLWDLRTGEKLRTTTRILVPSPFLGSITSVQFSSDGKRALLTDFGFEAHLWDVAKWEKTRSFFGAEEKLMVSAALSPDAKQALCAVWDGNLYLFDTDSGKLLRSFQAHRSRATAVAYAPRHNRAVSGGDDGAVRYWDLETGRELAVFAPGGVVSSVAISPDGTHAVCTTSNKSIHVWHLPND